jgi:hypothetical protein
MVGDSLKVMGEEGRGTARGDHMAGGDSASPACNADHEGGGGGSNRGTSSGAAVTGRDPPYPNREKSLLSDDSSN